MWSLGTSSSATTGSFRRSRILFRKDLDREAEFTQTVKLIQSRDPGANYDYIELVDAAIRSSR